MSWYKAMDISADNEGVNINVRCYLNSKVAVYELIEDILQAKIDCPVLNEGKETTNANNCSQRS